MTTTETFRIDNPDQPNIEVRPAQMERTSGKMSTQQ